VIEDAGGDERMGDPQERRAPQKRDEWRAAESPDHAFRREVAIPAFQSLRMGRRARISCAYEVSLSLLGSYASDAMRIELYLRVRAWEAAQRSRGVGVELGD
jgi:hypothetical protein